MQESVQALPGHLAGLRLQLLPPLDAAPYLSGLRPVGVLGQPQHLHRRGGGLVMRSGGESCCENPAAAVLRADELRQLWSLQGAAMMMLLGSCMGQTP